MKMKGTLLILGKESKNGIIFSKDCKVTYPEKVPVTIGFGGKLSETVDPKIIIGQAEITRDGERILCDCNITNLDESMMQALENQNPCELYVGGFYNRVFKEHNTVNSANLISMAVLPEHEVADDELKIVREE